MSFLLILLVSINFQTYKSSHSVTWFAEFPQLIFEW